MNGKLCALFLENSHTDPPVPLKSGQIEFLVSKDAQCSEMYARRIFGFFLIFSFKIFISSFWDIFQRKMLFCSNFVQTRRFPQNNSSKLKNKCVKGALPSETSRFVGQFSPPHKHFLATFGGWGGLHAALWDRALFV